MAHASDRGPETHGFHSPAGALISRAARIGSNLTDLCYPRDCVACGAPAGERMRWFCDECARAMPLVKSGDDCCVSCGRPFDGTMSVDRRCPECTEMKVRWDSGKTLMAYTGPAEKLVHGIKYRALRCLMDDIQSVAAEREDVMELLPGATLVPVPLFHTRLRERGFNQSEWLAELFSAISGAGCMKLLKRSRDTGTQTALPREERRRNVRGAFSVAGNAVVRAERKYVLVDDVITTGATLDACAAALRAAGALNVHVLTLAHA